MESMTLFNAINETRLKGLKRQAPLIPSTWNIYAYCYKF